jgi:hypothetical protein
MAPGTTGSLASALTPPNIGESDARQIQHAEYRLVVPREPKRQIDVEVVVLSSVKRAANVVSGQRQPFATRIITSTNTIAESHAAAV